MTAAADLFSAPSGAADSHYNIIIWIPAGFVKRLC